MRRIGVFALFFASFTPFQSSAETVSGNEFLEACSSEGDLAKEGFCVGYLIGVIEGVRYGSLLPFLATHDSDNIAETIKTAEKFLGACIPEAAEYGQHRDIAVRYIARNPESRHLPARGLILDSLREAFPCE